METREFEVRLDSVEERTVSGIAVPYGDTIDLGGIKERFERGAFIDPTDVKLFYGHKEPIGKVVRGEDTDSGYMIEAVISDTERGNEVHTLLRDGVLNKFSVGFEPLVDERDDDGVVVRKQARLREVSVVAFPAYENASVLSVREAEPTVEKEAPVEETQNTDVAELRSVVEDMDRRLAVLSEDREIAVPTTQFRSFGEFVHAVATGNEDALAMTRAFAGGVAGATVAGKDPISNDQWVSEVVRLVDLGRPTLNAFRQAPLPAEGMNIEWPAVKTNTIDVQEQAAEADVLHFGKISLESKTSPVKTFGGYTSMSRQAIERSSFGYLDVAFRAMAIAYSKMTNAQTVATLGAATGVGTGPVGGTVAAATAKQLFGVVADASLDIYTKSGLRPNFILASGDVYKAIAVLFDTMDRPLVAAGSPSNSAGSANIPALTGSLAGLPVIVDTALPAGSMYIANSEGLVTYQSGGAPYRLADEDVTNLTKEFSIYGYLAHAVPMPEAIFKATFS